MFSARSKKWTVPIIVGSGKGPQMIETGGKVRLDRSLVQKEQAFRNNQYPKINPI